MTSSKIALLIAALGAQPSHFLLFEYLEDSEDGWTDGRRAVGADSLPQFLLKKRARQEREGIRVWRVNFGEGVRGGIRHERRGDSSAKAIE